MKTLATSLLVATVTACDGTPSGVTTLEGTLAIEVIDSATVRIEPRAESDSTKVTVTSQAGYGVLPPGEPLLGEGYAETISETEGTFYSARFSSEPIVPGPCGNQPISLALSLHRQGQNAAVFGGLTAYCGADTWYGLPARVLRLAGDLHLPK
jgi:hypothetical protein